jgi:hypothetical protein
MLRPLFRTALPAALSLSLGLALPAWAQVGPGLSSGSGEGTGTGASSGIQRNNSGSVSGVGPGSASGPRGPEYHSLPPGGLPPSNMGIGAGPGVNTTFPDDSSLFPLGVVPGGGVDNPSGSSTVPPDLVDQIRLISTPGDRSLALQRLANAAIFSGQLALAHSALIDAADSALQESNQLVHDQRLIAIITSFMNLGEAHLREGKIDLSLPEFSTRAEADAKAAKPDANAFNFDRTVLIRRASAEWDRAATLAGKLIDPTFPSEMLYRIVDTMSFGSQTIVNDFPTHRTGTDGQNESFADPADRILRDAADVSRRIDRPVWRDRALVAIATAAAASRQFKRGLEVARLIPQPEVRTDALVKIAEAQARNDARGATATYHEAAEAVSSIPLDDPRAILTGVLIDNMISVGRFEDARATIVLYPDNARQMVALGAIAESQGRRGAAKSARDWISRDVPPEYRAQLYRRVTSGIMTAIEQNRSRDLSNRDR